MPATGMTETSGPPSPFAQSAEERLHLESQILAQVRDAVVAIDRDEQVLFWGGALSGLGPVRFDAAERTATRG